ncbi:nucleotidyltransferase domain-containing protein [Candidatus Pacearchaeota archaeon]|nr:nucleotidyltransferase domain-containing protein [Candidatus Pacearchaeota archaeon]
MKTKSGKTRQAKKYPTLDLKNEREIAMDFATKVYQKFDKIVKSIVLFGSSMKQNATSTSDVDIIIVIDDAAIQWDQELIAWYREELGKLIATNPYKKELHITTVRITTWWDDMMKGDPVIINVLRYGEALIDFGGFFNPLKILLQQGRIKPTPEAIYTALQRAPDHFRRSKIAELNTIEGLFWAMVDSAQAALMSNHIMPPSPEHIPILLKETFVDIKKLKMDYVLWYRDLYVFHRKIIHGEVKDVKGSEVDEWQKKTDDFIRVMTQLVKDSIS